MNYLNFLYHCHSFTHQVYPGTIFERSWIGCIIDKTDNITVSLGGVETLITRPASSSHAGVEKEIRVAQGVTDELIRVACGVEDLDDLIEDLNRVLGESHG